MRSSKGVKSDPGAQTVSDYPSFTFDTLSEKQCTALLEQDIEGIEQSIRNWLPAHSHLDLKAVAKMDIYSLTVWWAKERSSTAVQLGVLIFLVNKLLTHIENNPATTVADLMDLLKSTVQEVCATKFDLSVLSEIIKRIERLLISQLSLYLFLFHGRRHEHVLSTDVPVCQPPASVLMIPPPLNESVDEGLYALITNEPTDAADEPDDVDKNESEDVHRPIDSDRVSPEKLNQLSDILLTMDPQVVKTLVARVCEEELGKLEENLGQVMNDRRAKLIERINKIHIVAK